MLENTYSIAALERSLDKRGQQVRIRMVPELSHRLQSLTYDFGYFCHLLLPVTYEPSPAGASTFFLENAAPPVSCANRLRILTLRSRTSTSIASSACRRLIPRRPKAAKICLRNNLASLSTLRLMVDSCTPRVRAISAKVRSSRK